MKYLIFLFLLFSFSSSQITPYNFRVNQEKQTKALPFSIKASTSTNPIEVKATLDPNTLLSLAGFKAFDVGIQVPACGNYIQLFIDFSKWSSPINKKIYKPISIVLPKICASDFGIDIPWTSLCVTVDDLMIYSSGVTGRLVADIGVGVSALQYNSVNITLYSFKVGNVSDCNKFTDATSCVTNNTLTCGWCQSTSKCLPVRSDKASDICNTCPRCEFYTTNTTNWKTECQSKTSCGWCQKYSSCYAGDSLGPFDTRLNCDYVSSSSLFQTTSQDWQFNQPSNISLALLISMMILFLIIGVFAGCIAGGGVVSIASLLYIFITKKKGIKKFRKL